MNKKFTKLIAALALLVFMTPSMVGWGQTTMYDVTFDSSNNGSNDVHWTSTTMSSFTHDNITWSTSVTGTNSITASTTYAQIGSKNNPATQIIISTDAFAGMTISAVSLTGYCMSNTGPTLTITAGSTTLLNAAALVKTTSTEYVANANLPITLGNNDNLTFTINSSAKAAICISEIKVTYTSGGPTTYTVTYNANDGSATPATFTDDNGGEGYESEEEVTVMDNDITSNDNPSFSKTGYTFAAWSDMQDGTDDDATLYFPDDEEANSFTITENTTLYAQWDINKYQVGLSSIENVTLTATYGSPTTTINEGQTPTPQVNYNTEITLNATGLATGKVFVWDVYKTGESTTKVTVTDNKFNVPAFDVTISGSVVDLDYSNTYTSNVTIDGSDRVVISDVEYAAKRAGTSNNAGSWTVTVPVNTTKLHLHFAGWTSEDVTLTVTPSGYSDNISLTRNSGVSGNSTTYTWGSGNDDKDPSSSYHYKVITFDGPLEEAVTLTFTASSGKRFLVWGVNAEATTDPYITAADVDITSNATSGSIAYTVHNIPDPAGTLTAAVTTGGDWLTLGTVGETVPFSCSANPNAVERTATVTLTYTYGNNETTTETVTVTQAPLVVTYTYSLATSIKNGKHYLITNGKEGAVYAMGHDKGNNRNAKSVEVGTNGKISLNSDVINTENNVFEFVINGPEMITKNDQQVAVYTIYDGKNSKYLYAAHSSSNYLKSQSFNDANGQWTIEIDNEGSATIKAQGTNSNNWMRYNSSSTIFSCYSSTSNQNDIYLFERDDSYYDFYKDIAAHTDATGLGNTDGWYFIASPINSDYTPAGSMIANTYDLYRLNGNTWENFKNTDHADFTTLQNGQGYLYANSVNTTLHFSGAINTFTTENNANVKNLSEGWNLIGNPYNIPIYINKPYYKMNAARTGVETADGITSVAIPACTGVVINADSEDVVTFSTTAPDGANSNNGNLQMTLAQQATNRGNATTLDNAIVSFNEGSELGKFYFGTQNANLYIPQGNEEYAIVSTEAQGTMPVNFRANENGQYTLTVSPENVEMNYLHLIDNMTGADIDLLQTPSYTFNAKTTDYESRFRLVFSANNSPAENGNETFAYFNGSEWMISNMGEATLQVVDVMGRVLSTKTVNGNATINLNQTPGVYMFRLINGDSVKTQKIIVR